MTPPLSCRQSACTLLAQQLAGPAPQAAAAVAASRCAPPLAR
jgi:hypothetical protein